MNKNVLLVEDEKNFGAVLRDYLQMNGYNVTLCDDGLKGLDAFGKSNFDICILDVMMPKMDGFTLAAQIRKVNQQVPVLFLTAKSLRDDVVKGYKSGADDYMVKPIDTEVLLLKLEAILNRVSNTMPEGTSIHYIGSIEFNYTLRTITYPDGQQTRLSPKEAELMQLLCTHRNTVLPRSKALKLIWKDDNYFTGRSMDVFIVKLRKLLQRDPNVEIVSLHGNGYTILVK